MGIIVRNRRYLCIKYPGHRKRKELGEKCER